MSDCDLKLLLFVCDVAFLLATIKKWAVAGFLSTAAFACSLTAAIVYYTQVTEFNLGYGFYSQIVCASLAMLATCLCCIVHQIVQDERGGEYGQGVYKTV